MLAALGREEEAAGGDHFVCGVVNCLRRLHAPDSADFFTDHFACAAPDDDKVPWAGAGLVQQFGQGGFHFRPDGI